LRNDPYSEFVRSLEPIGLGLKECSSRFDRNVYSTIRKGDKAAVTEVAAKFELRHLEPRFFDATATYKLTIKDNKTGKEGLRVECIFETHVHGAPRLERSMVMRFVDSGLDAMIWPYFRSLVQDLAAKMSIGRIYVPIFGKP